jgi:hypothetical protein
MYCECENMLRRLDCHRLLTMVAGKQLITDETRLLLRSAYTLQLMRNRSLQLLFVQPIA